MNWLRLLRIAALPSALANIFVGYLLANESWTPALPLVLLLLASACLYCSGMILNDVFDYEVDKEQRPNSPLPSGAIQLPLAKKVGFGLLAIGPFIAAFASPLALGIALALALGVFLYDGPLKRKILAPCVMGSCRTLNILLGASTVVSIPTVVFWYAISIGIFVAGITWLARKEALKSQRSSELIPGSVLMTAALSLLVYCAWKFSSADGNDPRIAKVLPLAIAFISLPILRRLVLAWSTASGRAVQATVITSLRSLIIFDAAFSLLVANGRPAYSVAILGLLAASWFLGRSIRTT